MITKTATYWLYQLVGWSIFLLVHLFFFFTYADDKSNDNPNDNQGIIVRLLLYVVIGVSFSHLMRAVIKKARLLMQPLQQQLISFVLTTIAFSLLLGITESYLLIIFQWLLDSLLNNKIILNEFQLLTTRDLKEGISKQIIWGAISSFVYLFIWNCIYFIYHYIQKSRRQQLDTLKLEALVKELELKTIKAHINPHFIFNALNSIRALIDENPSRARTAITELSNILRSSMQSEKQEMVPFEKELNIVKDYLALEHIRFEDRLKVRYEIDEDTLDQPVPPMMLQTLVENAIKHGISKQLNGGSIKIISDFKSNCHELLVQNTGYLNGGINEDGFGLTSTQNRLLLLFGEKATFNIRQLNGNLVEARVEMPITTNTTTKQ
jgi:sensor histidine kinase YesM